MTTMITVSEVLTLLQMADEVTLWCDGTMVANLGNPKLLVRDDVRLTAWGDFVVDQIIACETEPECIRNKFELTLATRPVRKGA